MTPELKSKSKTNNEKVILKKGARICDWLPLLETTSVKSIDDIRGRMSVMNALINISFGAPTDVIKEWIEDQKLTSYLSKEEVAILKKDTENVTDEERNQLHWYLESLWALMWATNMIDALDPETGCADSMASLLPDLQQGEDNTKLNAIKTTRNEQELYDMLDLYYRLHWYTVDERVNGKEAIFHEGIIMERRRALEWAFNRFPNWDQPVLNT